MLPISLLIAFPYLWIFRDRGRILKFRAEVFDYAAFFFFGTFVVEGDELFEQLIVGEVFGPAVGVEDRGIEVVVE
jgi:hypothetical protein